MILGDHHPQAFPLHRQYVVDECPTPLLAIEEPLIDQLGKRLADRGTADRVLLAQLIFGWEAITRLELPFPDLPLDDLLQLAIDR